MRASRHTPAERVRRLTIADAANSDALAHASHMSPRRHVPGQGRRRILLMDMLAASVGTQEEAWGGEDYQPYEVPPALANQAPRLAAMRKSIQEAAVRPRTGFKVVMYALTTSDHAPTQTIGRLRAYAGEMNWRVHPTVFYDSQATADPLGRPAWTRAVSIVAGGFAQGVVTLDRAVVSTDERRYEEALNLFRDFQSFLAHVPHDWQQSHPTSGEALDG